MVALASWAGLAASAATAQQPAAPETVTIKGQVFYVCPRDRLRAAGLAVSELPREQNAFYALIEAANQFVDLPPDLTEAYQAAVDGRWPEGEAGRRLAEWIEQNRPALEQVRQALQRPGYQAPLLFGSPAEAERASFSMCLFPCLTAHRNLAKLMVVEGAFLRSQGQADAAMDRYLEASRLGSRLTGEPSALIDGLVGIAIQNLTLSAITQLVETGSVSGDVLTEAARTLDSLNAAGPDWERLITVERTLCQMMIDDVVDGSLPLGWFDPEPDMSVAGGGPPPGWADLVRRLRRLYLPDRAMKQQIARYFDEVAGAGRPHPDGTVRTIDEARLFEAIPAWNVVGRVFTPSFSHTMEMVLRARSNAERARLTVAAAAYKSAHGRWPVALADLVPTYVASVPPDPFTGAEFEYRPPAASGSPPKGLELINRKNEAEYLEKRKFAAILSPRASRWRRYVLESSERYRFTDAQRTSAEAILREIEGRAARYEQAEGAKLHQLIEADRVAEMEEKVGPLRDLFAELQRRIDGLATASQRAAATSRPAEEQKRRSHQGPPPTGR